MGDPLLSKINVNHGAAGTGIATFSTGAILDFDTSLASPTQTSYDVLTAVDIIDNGLTLNAPAGWSYQIVTGGNGEILQLFQPVVAGLPGDFNNDGKVDAGDYATWRQTRWLTRRFQTRLITRMTRADRFTLSRTRFWAIRQAVLALCFKGISARAGIFNVVTDEYWKELANTDDTLVFYMSSETLDGVVSKLRLQIILHEDKLLAVIEQATTPFQKVYISQFIRISKKLKGKEFHFAFSCDYW